MTTGLERLIFLKILRPTDNAGAIDVVVFGKVACTPGCMNEIRYNLFRSVLGYRRGEFVSHEFFSLEAAGELFLFYMLRTRRFQQFRLRNMETYCLRGTASKNGG